MHVWLELLAQVKQDGRSRAQNKDQKSVSHSLKVETLLQTIIGFPIKNV